MPIAWHEGYDFATNYEDERSSMDACPYDFDSDRWHVWMAGYEAGLSEGEP